MHRLDVSIRFVDVLLFRCFFFSRNWTLIGLKPKISLLGKFIIFLPSLPGCTKSGLGNRWPPRRSRADRPWPGGAVLLLRVAVCKHQRSLGTSQGVSGRPRAYRGPSGPRPRSKCLRKSDPEPYLVLGCASSGKHGPSRHGVLIPCVHFGQCRIIFKP